MYGKSIGGASVPLCIKLQGAVMCGRTQQQNNGTGYTCSTESLQETDAQDKQPCSPLNSPVCKPEDSHCQQPCGKEASSGNVFSLMF